MIESPSSPVPSLRASAIDVAPVAADGQRLFCLRDRLDPSSSPLVVSEPALLLASLLDGQRTVGAVRAAFLLRTGVGLPEGEIAAFVERLDQAGLLDSERLQRDLEAQRQAFLELEERPAIHAGSAYPAEPAELKRFLDDLYAANDGPRSFPSPANARVARGLIAPHIDLHRGGPTYAWTYKALAECEPADAYILLGTCHTPMQTPLAATRKPYATPLGTAPVDLELLSALEAAYPGDLYADEFSHRGEHSLEFQALNLRYLERIGESQGRGIVPLLCGSLNEWGSPDVRPLGVSQVAQTVTALRRVLADCGRRVCVVAGADLAHVGPQFGDSGPITPSQLERVGRDDAEMLGVICGGDAEGFYQQVMRDGDARRICGLSPIYYLLAALGGGEGRMLKYTQWADPGGFGSVTFAGIIFEA
jgi:AmmeMemoRadiSam system protein B